MNKSRGARGGGKKQGSTQNNNKESQSSVGMKKASKESKKNNKNENSDPLASAEDKSLAPIIVSPSSSLPQLEVTASSTATQEVDQQKKEVVDLEKCSEKENYEVHLEQRQEKMVFQTDLNQPPRWLTQMLYPSQLQDMRRQMNENESTIERQRILMEDQVDQIRKLEAECDTLKRNAEEKRLSWWARRNEAKKQGANPNKKSQFKQQNSMKGAWKTPYSNEQVESVVKAVIAQQGGGIVSTMTTSASVPQSTVPVNQYVMPQYIPSMSSMQPMSSTQPMSSMQPMSSTQPMQAMPSTQAMQPMQAMPSTQAMQLMQAMPSTQAMQPMQAMQSTQPMQPMMQSWRPNYYP